MKKNWILLLGAFAIAIYLICLNICGAQNNSRNMDMSRMPYNMFVLIALLMPFFEEVVFRGIFTSPLKIKNFYWFVFAIVPTIWLFTAYNIVFSLIFLSIFFLSWLLKLKKYVTNNVDFFAILSSIVFALVHYSLNDLKNLNSAYPVFLHFGLGLFLTWSMINYGLKKTTFLHISYNLTICIYLSIPLFIIEAKVNSVTIDKSSLTWKEHPRKLYNNLEIINKSNEVIIKSASIADIDKVLLENEINKKYQLNRNHFMLYDVKIKVKNDLEMKKKIIKLLLKAKLIK